MNTSEIVLNEHYGGFNPVQFGHEDCDPSHSYGPAVRTHWLLHYVSSGCGKFTRGGVTHSVGAGQIFVIPPYEETFYQADAKRPWRYIWIGFTADDGEVPPVFGAPVLSSSKFGRIFDDMLTCDRLENGKSAFLSGCIWRLVSVLLEKDKNKPSHVDKALGYMHSNYANGITVSEVAASVGLDRKYLSVLFSKQVGMSPSKYLIALRLSKAAELMSKHGESPTTAAVSVGYYDICHFSKVFKSHFGVSPREYVKKGADT